MNVALASTPTKVKLTVDQFDLLAESGGLAGLERSELLDGDIYLMAPQYSRHGMAKARIYEALLDWKRQHRADLVVLSEVSVAMPPSDEPMPDVILCDPPKGRKAIAVDTVKFLVEIADGSGDYDLDYKAPLYAQQGVPEYWVVDFATRYVVRHNGPSAAGYADVVPVAFGETVSAVTLVGLEVGTDGLD